MRSQKRGELAKPWKKNAQTAGCYPKSSCFLTAYTYARTSLLLLLTFYPTKKHLRSAIYGILRKNLRGYVFGIVLENPAVQDIPSAILLFLVVGMRWVCSRDSAGTQLAARGFPRYKVGNLCWFWAMWWRARDGRYTLTYILFSL